MRCSIHTSIDDLRVLSPCIDAYCDSACLIAVKIRLHGSCAFVMNFIVCLIAEGIDTHLSRYAQNVQPTISRLFASCHETGVTAVHNAFRVSNQAVLCRQIS